MIFDQYGNSISKVSGIDDFISIRIIFEWMTLSTEKHIYIANLRASEITLKEVLLENLPLNTKIVTSLIFNNKLYLLTKKEILVFNRI